MKKLARRQQQQEQQQTQEQCEHSSHHTGIVLLSHMNPCESRVQQWQFALADEQSLSNSDSNVWCNLVFAVKGKRFFKMQIMLYFWYSSFSNLNMLLQPQKASKKSEGSKERRLIYERFQRFLGSGSEFPPSWKLLIKFIKSKCIDCNSKGAKAH